MVSRIRVQHDVYHSRPRCILVPALYDPALSMDLAQHLFDLQMGGLSSSSFLFCVYYLYSGPHSTISRKILSQHFPFRNYPV